MFKKLSLGLLFLSLLLIPLRVVNAVLTPTNINNGSDCFEESCMPWYYKFDGYFNSLYYFGFLVGIIIIAFSTVQYITTKDDKKVKEKSKKIIIFTVICLFILTILYAIMSQSFFA